MFENVRFGLKRLQIKTFPVFVDSDATRGLSAGSMRALQPGVEPRFRESDRMLPQRKSKLRPIVSVIT